MEAFLEDLNIDFIYLWLTLQFKEEANVEVKVLKNNEYCRRIGFSCEHLVGKITLWHNHILEEEINNDLNTSPIFYLHYHFQSVAHFMNLYQEFYHCFISHFRSHRIHIGILSSNGISSTPFVHMIQEIQKYEDTSIVIEALSIDEFKEKKERYKALYLAPQLEEEYPFYLKESIPAYLIDPHTYATKNALSMLNTIKCNLKTPS